MLFERIQLNIEKVIKHKERQEAKSLSRATSISQFIQNKGELRYNELISDVRKAFMCGLSKCKMNTSALNAPSSNEHDVRDVSGAVGRLFTGRLHRAACSASRCFCCQVSRSFRGPAFAVIITSGCDVLTRAFDGSTAAHLAIQLGHMQSLYHCCLLCLLFASHCLTRPRI